VSNSRLRVLRKWQNHCLDACEFFPLSNKPRTAAALLWDTRACGVLLVVVLLCMWEASVRLDIVQSVNWPAFSVVIVALVRGVFEGDLGAVIGATLWRVVRGYAIGSCIGIIIGFCIALWRPVRLTIEPTLEILRTIPATAVIPPLIFIFGLGDPLKLFIIAFAVMFPVALNTITGVASIDPIYLQVARTFGLSRLRTFYRVIFPATLPFIMAGLRTSLGLALIVAVVAEMIAGGGGVGAHLLDMQFALRAPDMYAGILLLAIVAYLINQAFVGWEARMIHWARTREASWTEQ
jgi:ABC-type nitrate/sulfonate/bicarbonate transport system permease component